ESTLKGTVVSLGATPIVTGRVRILLDPHQVGQIREGEVLVAPMTSPEYIFAMKKAIAIVTDTGGLTSHAAIVSRELKKPCIVGTKFATRMLKDGDLVEVDTKNGVVRRLD
ncbi:MAG: PEP-utilizing enzyme, partial [Candidatus Diapherotrites archaeon]|nr:PEP-utilizing enzyme [Candidatus Diapherotrites archaeon]